MLSFIISGYKDFNTCIKEICRFLPFVDNWATCDQLSPKILRKHHQELLPYIHQWLSSDRTYTVRFAIKILMDHFLEEVVIKRNTVINRIIYYLSWILIVLFAVYAALIFGTLTTNFQWFSVIQIVIFGGSAVLLYLYHDRLLTEYEYTFTNGSLDFAEVYNNKKRKTLGSLNVKTVDAERFRPVRSTGTSICLESRK